MKGIVTVVRILTGALFIFSGLVKAIDPRGLAYKMQEFFEAFARDGFLPGMMHTLRDHALTFSIIIITLEVIIGLAVLLGWKRKFTLIILLLLILLFTFLTSYVLFSGKIRACGCFGDCIPISPVQTFTKDIILLIFALFLLWKIKYIYPVAKPMVLAIYLILAILLTLWLQYYVMMHLPVVDCLPFKKGNNILELRKMPANSIPDKYDYTFIYEKGGEKKEFPASALPDETWTFVDRKQILIQKGSNNIPLINDFSLIAEDGTDLTDTIMNSQGEYYLLFLEMPSDQSGKWLPDFNKTNLQPLFIVTSQPAATRKFVKANNIKTTQILTCDATAIKTAARSNPALYKMKGPVVQDKWGWADFDDVK